MMQVMIKHGVVPALLTIERTTKCLQALSDTVLSARERQLLLLLDKYDELSVQAVTSLINKVDIAKLANKGLVDYSYQRQTTAEPTAATLTPSQPSQPSVSVDDSKPAQAKEKNSKLQAFFSRYGSLPKSASLLEVPSASQPQGDNQPITVPAQSSSSPAGAHSAADFEDIMIAQGLLLNM